MGRIVSEIYLFFLYNCFLSTSFWRWKEHRYCDNILSFFTGPISYRTFYRHHHQHHHHLIFIIIIIIIIIIISSSLSAEASWRQSMHATDISPVNEYEYDKCKILNILSMSLLPDISPINAKSSICRRRPPWSVVKIYLKIHKKKEGEGLKRRNVEVKKVCFLSILCRLGCKRCKRWIKIIHSSFSPYPFFPGLQNYKDGTIKECGQRSEKKNLEVISA